MNRWSITSSLLVWLLLPVLAQEVRPVATLEELVRLIDQAKRQVVLVAPSLYSSPIASALHRAAVQRGVQVLLLLEAEGINQPSSYGAALSFLAPERPLYVRVVRAVLLEPRLLLDSRLLVSGPLVAGDTFSERPTQVSRRFTDLALEVDRFNRVWQQAPSCRPTAYTLGERVVLRCRF